MAADLSRLGERIEELRGSTPRAVVARRAGVSAAYLHALEKARPDKTSGEPVRPSIPVVRSIAFALPAALPSELLELAGYDEDIIAYDRMRERRAGRSSEPQPEPTTPSPTVLASELRRLIALLEGSEAQPGHEGGPGAQPLRAVPPGNHHTDNQGRAG